MVAALNGRPEGRWTGLEEKRKERRERKRKKEREERDPIFFLKCLPHFEDSQDDSEAGGL